MWRASEVLKIEVLKNAFRKTWTKNASLIVKIEYNIDFENIFFQFLIFVGLIMSKKLIIFSYNFVTPYQKIPLVL